MSKRILRDILVILFVSLVFIGNGLAGRDKEVGVVEYKKFKWKNANYYYKTYTKPLFNTIKDLGFSPEWVSMDIFLPENKTKRDRYKRIVVSAAGLWFTPEMYEGITDYVKSGGLLITNSSLFLVDADRNYRLDEGDTQIKNGFRTVGVYGTASVFMTKIKVEVACPLTKGIPAERWIELEEKLPGRVTTNRSAVVLLIAKRWSDKWGKSNYKGWKPPKGNQPFLTFKHSGKGACIYIVPVLGPAKAKYLSIILKNSLSKKTLEWLTTE